MLTVFKTSQCWHRKSILDLKFTNFPIVLIILIVGLTTALTTNENNTVCLTPECTKAASEIFDSVDPSVDPCEDFYEFTCGEFDKKERFPASSVAYETLQYKLHNIFEKPILEEKLESFKLPKKFYKACMNINNIKLANFTFINDIIIKLGGWPVMNTSDWKEENFDWKQMLYNFRRIGYGTNYLISFSVVLDCENTTIRSIELDQPVLSLNRELLIKGFADNAVKKHFDYMVDLAVAMGAERKQAEHEYRDVLEFEMKLANISISYEAHRNFAALCNKMSIKELQTNYSSIPWREFINNLLMADFLIDVDEIITITEPNYIKKFEDIITNTSKRIQANYLIWRIVQKSAPYTTYQIYGKPINLSNYVAPRWRICTVESMKMLGRATGALYVRNYFKEESRRDVQEMFINIQSEFENIVKKVDWMDEDTRKQALEKIDTMISNIGYPDEFLDDLSLEDFYKSLDIDEKNYLKSWLNIKLFNNQLQFGRLREIVNKTDWRDHAWSSLIIPQYILHENSIDMPAGMLQGVYFNADRPKYMNYGAIGSVIGHQMTYGVDESGRQFDIEGNVVDWWTLQTEKLFSKKTKCVIDQYRNYTISTIGNWNGINTPNNIANTGGLNAAYRGYNAWLSQNQPENKLPGLDYTPKQLLWISYGMIHCPYRYEVTGPITNLEEFSEDFRCPLGSKMNPESKCEVW